MLRGQILCLGSMWAAVSWTVNEINFDPFFIDYMIEIKWIEKLDEFILTVIAEVIDQNNFFN